MGERVVADFVVVLVYLVVMATIYWRMRKASARTLSLNEVETGARPDADSAAPLVPEVPVPEVLGVLLAPLAGFLLDPLMPVPGLGTMNGMLCSTAVIVWSTGRSAGGGFHQSQRRLFLAAAAATVAVGIAFPWIVDCQTPYLLRGRGAPCEYSESHFAQPVWQAFEGSTQPGVHPLQPLVYILPLIGVRMGMRKRRSTR